MVRDRISSSAARLDVGDGVVEQGADWSSSVGHDASSIRERRAATPRDAWLFTAPRLMPRVVGDLRLGQVEVVAQREHLALPVGQLPHRVEHGARAARRRSASSSAPRQVARHAGAT